MADAKLRITAQDATGTAFASVVAKLQGFSAGAKEAAEKIEGLFNKITIAIAGVGAVEFGKEIVKKAADSQRALNLLQATLNATGNAAGFTAGGLTDLAEKLAKSSTFDDDEIQKGITTLLRFSSVYGDTFERATKLGVDLAASTDRNVVGAFERLGRALQDPETGLKTLRDAGVKLDDAQKDLITRLLDAGRVAEAQAVILDVLAKRVGGAAGAETEGLFGALKATDKAYDDFLKTLGKTGPVAVAAQSSLGAITLILENASAALKEQSALIRNQALFTGQLPSNAETNEQTRKINDALQGKTLADIQKLNQAPFTGRIGPEIPKRIPKGDTGLSDLIKAQLQVQLELEKQAASQRQEILDDYHTRGLISENNFYSARLAIVQQELTAELAATEKAIAAQQKLVDKAPTAERNARQAELTRLQGQQTRLQSDLNFAGLRNAEERKDAELKFADAIADVNARLLEQQHQEAAAAGARFDIQNRLLKQQLVTNLGPEANVVKQLERIKELTVANAQLNELTEQGAILRDKESIQEERIQNSQRVGAIGELEALRQTDAARQQSLQGLRDIADQMQRVADATNDPKQLQAVARFKADIDALAISADLFGDKFRTIFQDNLTAGLDDFILKSHDAGKAFEVFAKGVINELVHIANQEVALAVFGRGGAASGVPGFFAGLFGGAAAGGGTAAGSASFAGRMAGGGSLTAGQFAVVGEKGPELLFAGGSGTVVPPGKGGGGDISVSVSVDARGAVSSSGGDGSQLGRAIGKAVQAELIAQQRPGGLLFARV